MKNIKKKFKYDLNTTDVRRIVLEDNVCPIQLTDKMLSIEAATALLK